MKKDNHVDNEEIKTEFRASTSQIIALLANRLSHEAMIKAHNHHPGSTICDLNAIMLKFRQSGMTLKIQKLRHHPNPKERISFIIQNLSDLYNAETSKQLSVDLKQEQAFQAKNNKKFVLAFILFKELLQYYQRERKFNISKIAILSHELAQILVQVESKTQARELFEKAINLRASLTLSKDQDLVNYCISYVKFLCNLQDYNKALIFIERIDVKAIKKDQQRLIEVNCIQSAILYRLKNKKGITILNKQLQKIQKQKDIESWEKLVKTETQIIGQLREETVKFWNQKMYAIAPYSIEKKLQKSANYFESCYGLEDRRTRDAYERCARELLNHSQQQQALIYYDKAIQGWIKSQGKLNIMTLIKIQDYGKVLMKNKRYRDAIDKFSQVQKAFEDLEKKKSLEWIHAAEYHCQALQQYGKNKQAEELIAEMVKVACEIGGDESGIALKMKKKMVLMLRENDNFVEQDEKLLAEIEQAQRKKYNGNYQIMKKLGGI